MILTDVIYGRRRKELITEPNLIIGGVGGTTINSIEDLRSRLTQAGSVVEISFFEIVENTVNAIIYNSYNVLTNAFLNDPNLTSFTSTGGQLDVLESSCFQGSNLNTVNTDAKQIQVAVFQDSKITGEVEFPELITCSGTRPFRGTGITKFTAKKLISINSNGSETGSAMFRGNTVLSVIDTPLLSSIGTTTGDNSVFDNIPLGCEIICSESLQTANAGAEEGDIAYARNTRSAIITYV